MGQEKFGFSGLVSAAVPVRLSAEASVAVVLVLVLGAASSDGVGC